MFTLDDLKEYLEQRDAADTTFFIKPAFLSAIVGLTDDDRLVYDYDKMIAAPSRKTQNGQKKTP